MDTIEKITTLGRRKKRYCTKYEVPAAAGRLCPKNLNDQNSCTNSNPYFFVRHSAFGVRHWKKYQVTSIKYQDLFSGDTRSV
jgi:hypothetical protein